MSRSWSPHSSALCTFLQIDVGRWWWPFPFRLSTQTKHAQTLAFGFAGFIALGFCVLFFPLLLIQHKISHIKTVRIHWTYAAQSCSSWYLSQKYRGVNPNEGLLASVISVVSVSNSMHEHWAPVVSLIHPCCTNPSVQDIFVLDAAWGEAFTPFFVLCRLPAHWQPTIWTDGKRSAQPLASFGNGLHFS